MQGAEAKVADNELELTAQVKQELSERLRRLRDEGREVVGRGHQGDILGLEIDGRRLVVKTVHGRALGLWLRRRMLAREYRAYRRLDGVTGVPRCLGLVEREFLLLERVEGDPYRVAEIHDRGRFFERLLHLIRDLHDRGVAHGDIKGKNNLFVGPDEQPYLLDFGVSLVEPSGFNPLHSMVHRLLAQMDLNSWVKLKYDRDYSNLSPEDAKIFRRTLPERLNRKIKWGLLRLRFPARLLPVKNRLETGGRRPSRSSRASVQLARQRLGELRGKTEGAATVRAGSVVAIQMFDGLYAEVEQGGRMVARSDRPEDAELFEVGVWAARDSSSRGSERGAECDGRVLEYGDLVTFRSIESGSYVVVAAGDRQVLSAGGEDPEHGGLFLVIPSRLSPEDPGQIRYAEFFGLRSPAGRNFRYAADTDGELTASSPRCNFWESLALVVPPGQKTARADTAEEDPE